MPKNEFVILSGQLRRSPALAKLHEFDLPLKLDQCSSQSLVSSPCELTFVSWLRDMYHMHASVISFQRKIKCMRLRVRNSKRLIRKRGSRLEATHS